MRFGTGFHGKVLAASDFNTDACRQCHGPQYTGGTSGVSCRTCHASYPHSDSWLTTSSPLYHGKYLEAKNFNATECKACHGNQLNGGTSGVSCGKCHTSYPHPVGWVDSTSVLFHGTYLGSKSYNTAECQQCHGQQYDGGTSGVSCKTCHSTFPHPQGWNTSSDPLFHGVYLKSNSYTTTACQPCHGTNYDGGRTGVSCRTCHATFPHTAGWVTTSATDFHGVYLKSNGYNLSECQNCHGAQYTGGTSGVSCFTCHSSFPHVQGWTTESSASFHGKYLEAKSYVATECQACHGTQYDGGTSGFSCKTCHASFPHPSGWVGSGSSSHIAFIKSVNFDLSSCRVCHGQDYGTVKVDNSCLTCHTQTGGPEACNTCHGSATNPAPPVDLDGNSATTYRGVGAHQAHLVTGTLGAHVQCAECHTVPATLDAPGHLGSDIRAEVVFNDTLARLPSRDGELVPNPSYDYASFTCSNTYCHGNWVLRKATSLSQFEYTDSIMVGANASVVWTGGSTEAQCGSCHGLPPTGHAAATLATCQNCHLGVVDGTGAIIDPTKHINGVINVFNTERPIR